MPKRNLKKAIAKKKAQAELIWFFPSTDHGENDGFSDSLLEYFQGDHEKYIAREAIQNAVDARLDNSKPVEVVFEKFSIPVTALPGRDELLDRVRRCFDFVKGQEKAENFFKSAIALLKGKDVSILKISDFNTKGLTGGDNEIEGNWYRLVRAAGTSSPKGVTGGSFGIGKGAPIAASSLRTVFYSSINDKGELVCQGKTRLVSHLDEARDVRRGVGFYGIDGYRAIRDAKLIPPLFKRNARGTDIFVMGYKAKDDWQEKLIKSVLYNFWLSISGGNLEVTVRDGSEIKITKENLGKCLEDYDAQDARFFFEAFINPTRTFEQELRHLGRVSLLVKKDERYPGRVMMVRKPKMLVQEKPYRVLREPYAGVFICEDDKGNAILRDLEPPAHDRWDPARAEGGQAALRELDSFIKQSLKTMAESSSSEPEDIPGLSDYLPDSDDRDYSPSDSKEALEETGLSTEEESAREVGAARNSESAGDEATVVRKGIVTNKQQEPVKPIPPQGPGKGPRGRATGPDEGENIGARINTSAINFRSFVQRGKKGPEYHFVISAREDCKGAVRIVAIGDDGSYPAELESATDAKSGKSYEVAESLIKGLELKGGETAKLAVRLKSNKRYALGIETYEG